MARPWRNNTPQELERQKINKKKRKGQTPRQYNKRKTTAIDDHATSPRKRKREQTRNKRFYKGK